MPPADVLAAANATVTSAATHGPKSSPLSAERPEGRSAAITGRPEALIAATIRAASAMRAVSGA